MSVETDLTLMDANYDKVKNKMVLYIDALINEVKKRPFLWDKKHQHYGCRTKVARSWHAIAATLKKRPQEVKAKWRNLKDSFHRLEKQIEFPPDEDTPLESYYTGQWIHFEKLLFLKDTRRGRINNEDYVEADVPEICIEDIKGEFDISEYSNDSSVRHNNIDNIGIDKSEEPEEIYTEPVISLQNVLSSTNVVPSGDEDVPESRKRVLDPLIEKGLDGIESKRRTMDLTTEEAVIDEDLHFVKSLVPFLRKLNPIRKLIVRNEIQNLLIKEMLCENCQAYGIQPKCRCNLS